MQRVLKNLFDLERVLGAIYFVAGYALLELRAMRCVGSSRLGMLDCNPEWRPGSTFGFEVLVVFKPKLGVCPSDYRAGARLS